MEISANNYKKYLSPDLIKKASKCNVRECDEIGPGQFQAYVDENKQSFDVNITMDNKEVLTYHDCDCGCEATTIFCQHKLALLLSIVGNKKEKRSPGRSKKSDQLDVLLRDINIDELKAWIKGLLEKNKDLELSFIHQFSNKRESHSPDDLKRLTLDAVKAVIKSRKKAETAEVKKIVDLWTEIHDPFIDRFCADPADELAFLRLNAIINTCEEVTTKINPSGNRLNKYLESQLLKVIVALNTLEKGNIWKTALEYFVNQINKNIKLVTSSYLTLLVDTLNTPANKEGILLIDQLMQGFISADLAKSSHVHVYTEALFRIVVNSGLFEKYYQHFRPITFNNEYNKTLITLLIQDGHLRLAEKYCTEQIESNYREEYDILYMQLLKSIYVIEKNDDRLTRILMDLFPVTYDFDDYLFVMDKLKNEEEKKKWRSKLLSRARHTTNNPDAVNFVFKLADAEKSYKKMIGYINEYVGYSLIVEYAEKMILSDKQGFLQALFRKVDNWYSMDEDDAVDVIPVLFDILKKHYSMSEIEAYIKAVRSEWMYGSNLLITYITEVKKIK